ncbi:MAG: hypothetical protein JW991_02370 [Candidatus Pacebacteria bacterium]|nr:hypothetical protein [Candidatus Paceibacterota bacterium]
MVTIFASPETNGENQARQTELPAKNGSALPSPGQTGKIMAANNQSSPLGPLPQTASFKVFTPPIARLFKTYQDFYRHQQFKADIAVIHVDEIASKLAFFYEGIRKIIDWKEEHLVRRSAIERILKRKMISKIAKISRGVDFNSIKIAEQLVMELIRGGHFPNDKIPRQIIEAIRKTLEKYSYILQNNPLSKDKEQSRKIKLKINLYNWALEIAACEIEETLEPPVRQNALIDCMLALMEERIRITPAGIISAEEIRKNLYIAIHRTLFHLDAPIIGYRLIKNRWPQWENPTPAFLDQITQNIFPLIERVEKELNDPLSGKLAAVCEKYDTLYLLLADILETYADKPEEIPAKIVKPEDLRSQIKKVYNKRIKTLKKRLYRAAVYSTLSIFVAGGLSLFAFEVPLASLVYGEWEPTAVVVDLLLPTAVMAILVAMISPPKKSNLDTVIRETLKIAYPTKEMDVYELKVRQKKSKLLNYLVSFLYLLGSIASLALVFWAFKLARVPATSLYIDTLNVAMIFFAATIIKQRAKELTVEERTSFWEFFLDILSVPMAKLGQWLSAKWKEYNIVSVFFMALVDTPFSSFIGFVENWSSFLKEKKSEISR